MKVSYYQYANILFAEIKGNVFTKCGQIFQNFNDKH